MLRRLSSKKDRSLSLSAMASSPIEKKNQGFSEDKEVANTGSQHYSVQTFTFLELLTATNNFRVDCFLGEGEFGKVYKGWLNASNQAVAIKRFDLYDLQGNLEFLFKALKLSFHHHTFLVKFIGLCVDGEQRLLVYEYMPLGSLDDHLFGKGWLDWNTRIKIADGAAKGIEYLHNKVTPPVIYGDLKCSSILLGDGHHPKLSSFGLAKPVLFGDNSNVPTRPTGTHGYHAPEYVMTGQLTLKTDIYSLGVVLLEMITGMRAIDKSRKAGEQSLVAWAHSMSKTQGKIFKMVDPRLHGQYPKKCFYQVFILATLCVNKDPTRRPLISDVVTTLSFLSSQAYDTKIISQISTKKMDSHSCTRGIAYETSTMDTFTKNIPSQAKDVQDIIKERRKLHSEVLSDASNSVTIVAALYAALAFAAIYTILGGRGTNGVAVHTTCFMIFYICNAITIFNSLVVLLVQVTLVPGEIKAKRRVVFIVNKLMWLTTVCIIISFSALSLVLLDNPSRWIAILFTVVGGCLITGLLATLAYKVLKSKKTRKHWNKRKFPRRSAGSNSRRFISSDLELGLIYAV